ncbi:RHS repeat domain-containing protein [Asticcacaulis tiandongensis]|uniref:RHS repeat domain-containing protein n=1 Tax=Asticcacaulis tiandongensis TaxID=2565365 RepID=UPI0011289AEB|nr:RHS repeat domain-containing protein [Asticcacaulis tiandongensis]
MSRKIYGRVAIVGVICAVAGASSVMSGNTQYSYDALGRVTSVCYPDSTKITYQYDAAGNRTQIVRAATGTGGTCTSGSGSSSSSSSSSGGGGGSNTAPVCTNQTVNMGYIPGAPGISITITAAQVIGRCTDANGDTLIVTSPAMPRTFTIGANQTVHTNFTVSDGNGGTGTGTITYIRN